MLGDKTSAFASLATMCDTYYVSAAKVLVTVNTDEARKVVEKMKNHYTRVGKIQVEHAISMAKSPMLQNITASTIPLAVREVLEAAPKDTGRLGALAVHEHLAGIISKLVLRSTGK